MKKEVLGVYFDDLTREEAAQAGAALLAEDKFHYVVTPNPEFILTAEGDPSEGAGHGYRLRGGHAVLPQ